MTESNRIEYKRELTDSLEKEREEFFAGYSIPRNKTLMRVFKDLGMVEYLGSGIPRILKTYSRDAYHFTSRFIRSVFPIDQQVLVLNKKDSPKTSEKTSEKILRLLKRQPSLTIVELANQTEVSARSVERNIKKLQEAGELQRVGPDKGEYWQVVEK